METETRLFLPFKRNPYLLLSNNGVRAELKQLKLNRSAHLKCDWLQFLSRAINRLFHTFSINLRDDYTRSMYLREDYPQSFKDFPIMMTHRWKELSQNLVRAWRKVSHRTFSIFWLKVAYARSFDIFNSTGWLVLKVSVLILLLMVNCSLRSQENMSISLFRRTHVHFLRFIFVSAIKWHIIR